MKTTERLALLILPYLNKPQEITPDTTFEQLGMDSLDSSEFCMVIEDEFDIQLKDTEFEACGTLGELTTLVKNSL